MASFHHANLATTMHANIACPSDRDSCQHPPAGPTTWSTNRVCRGLRNRNAQRTMRVIFLTGMKGDKPSNLYPVLRDRQTTQAWAIVLRPIRDSFDLKSTSKRSSTCRVNSRRWATRHDFRPTCSSPARSRDLRPEPLDARAPLRDALGHEPRIARHLVLARRPPLPSRWSRRESTGRHDARPAWYANRRM